MLRCCPQILGFIWYGMWSGNPGVSKLPQVILMCSKIWELCSMILLVFSRAESPKLPACAMDYIIHSLFLFQLSMDPQSPPLIPWRLLYYYISNGHSKAITAIILGDFHIQVDNVSNILSFQILASFLVLWLSLTLPKSLLTQPYPPYVLPITSSFPKLNFKCTSLQPLHPIFQDHLLLSSTLTIPQLCLDLSLDLQLFYHLFTTPYHPHFLTSFLSSLDPRIHQYRYSLIHTVSHCLPLHSSPLAKRQTWVNISLYLVFICTKVGKQIQKKHSNLLTGLTLKWWLLSSDRPFVLPGHTTHFPNSFTHPSSELLWADDLDSYSVENYETSWEITSTWVYHKTYRTISLFAHLLDLPFCSVDEPSVLLCETTSPPTRWLSPLSLT